MRHVTIVNDRVSLNEAYEFSYNETLGRTAKTQGGAQHLAYDIQMAGTGEMIITDVREMSASLVFPEELTGNGIGETTVQIPDDLRNPGPASASKKGPSHRKRYDQ